MDVVLEILGIAIALAFFVGCIYEWVIKPFIKPSRQQEDEEVIRIDLEKEYYAWLKRAIALDDTGSIGNCVKAWLKRDKKGYFIRLTRPEFDRLHRALRSLWEKVSDEFQQIMVTKHPRGLTPKYIAMRKDEQDLRSLLEVFDYQCCPEEYHPFGPR